MALIAVVLAVDLPTGSEYPQFSQPALAGDLLQLDPMLYQGGAATQYMLDLADIDQGQIRVRGAIAPGEYELRNVSLSRNGVAGTAESIALVIPQVSIAVSAPLVAGVTDIGGVPSAVADINATMLYAITRATTTYTTTAQVKAALGSLKSGSSPSVAGSREHFAPWVTALPESDYIAWFAAENGEIQSNVVSVPFRTLEEGATPGGNDGQLIPNGHRLIVEVY